MSRTLFLLILLLLQAKTGFGQLHLYPKIGMNTSFTFFSENDYVNRGLSNKPAFFRTFGIGVSQNLSEKLSLQGEIVLPPLGHKVSLISNYKGNRKFENKFTQSGYIRCQQLNINLQFEGKPGNSGWVKYAKIGVGAFFKTRKSDYLNNYTYINSDPVSGATDSSVFVVHEFADSFLKPGILIGLGIKKNIHKQNFISFGLTYQQGFSTLTTTQITYQAEGQIFTNLLLNKGNALVLEATYAIALRKKKEGAIKD